MKHILRWKKTHMVNKMLDDWRITPSLFILTGSNVLRAL